jgi:hypothetical protein
MESESGAHHRHVLSLLAQWVGEELAGPASPLRLDVRVDLELAREGTPMNVLRDALAVVTRGH